MGAINVWNMVKFFTLGDLMLPLENNEIRFLVASNDDVRVIYNDNRLNLMQGDFLILNSKSTRAVEQTKDAILISLFVDGSEDSRKSYGDNIANKIEGCSAYKTSEFDKQLQTCLLNLIRTRTNGEDYIEADVYKNYYEIISLVYKHYIVSDSKEQVQVEKFGNQAKKAYEIRDYVQQNYKKNITLDQVAEHFYLSTPYLSRLFKKIFEISFHKYITNLRIDGALSELINTEKTVTDITFDNGFPNVGSLNTAFKRKYGTTPGNYRLKYKEKKEHEKNAREFVEPTEQMGQLSQLKKTPQSTNSLKVVTDLFTNKWQHLATSWKKVINIGPAGLVGLNVMEKQISQIQAEFKFEYGRIFDLFTDEMLMVNSSNQDQFSFSKIDDALEVLLQNGLKPMIELGKKRLNVHMNYSERIYNSASYDFISQNNFSWPAFLESFLKHCIARWGYDEVKEWMFELWLPSQTVSTSGKEFFISEKDLNHYLSMFAATKRSIKKVIPEAKVGGCGLSIDIDSNVTERIINKWQEKVLPDFFSIYLYPQSFKHPQDEQVIQNEIFTDVSIMKNMIDDTKRTMRDTKFVDIPLYVTEWNISISDRNYIHDSLFKADYIIETVLGCANKVEMFGYWQLSDLYGTFGSTPQLLHGGSGLITKDDIPKASFFSFIFLNKLKGNVLYRDDNIIITAEGYKRINILIYNKKNFNSIYHLKKENLLEVARIENAFEDILPLKQIIRLKDIQSGTYRVKKIQLDKKNGDILSHWIEWNQALNLSKEDISYLKQVCRPKLLVQSVKVKDFMDLEVNLDANAVIFYELLHEL